MAPRLRAYASGCDNRACRSHASTPSIYDVGGTSPPVAAHRELGPCAQCSQYAWCANASDRIKYTNHNPTRELTRRVVMGTLPKGIFTNATNPSREFLVKLRRLDYLFNSKSSVGLILNCSILADSRPLSPPLRCMVIRPIFRLPAGVTCTSPLPKNETASDVE